MPLRLLVYRSLRAEKICLGREEGPETEWSREGCPLADTVRCICGETWVVDEPKDPGDCPVCGQFPKYVERCISCPINKVSEVRADSQAGRLLEAVLHLDFVTETFSVPFDTVTAEEVMALQILRDERNKHRIEEMKEEKERREHEDRVRQVLSRAHQ